MDKCPICEKSISIITNLSHYGTQLGECLDNCNNNNIWYEFSNDSMLRVRFNELYWYECIIIKCSDFTHYRFYKNKKFLFEIISNDYVTNKDKVIFVMETVKKIKENIMFF